MQVVKPQAMGLSTRPIEYRQRFGLCITAALHVPFAQGEKGALWGEQSMWDFLAAEMGEPLIDEGVAKLTPEFLVHGKAFPPPQQQQTACAVRASLGGTSKTLLVFGQRFWDGTRASAPQPFDSMPIDWARAYGGPDMPTNPAGVGRQLRDGHRPLPNIERADDPLRHPDHAAQPAGWHRLDPGHPQRLQYRGTYDADYLKLHSPGFAPDLDWRYFNLAPADQWLAGPLRGDEPFVLENLHPREPRIEGRLPGLRARVFASYAVAGSEPKLREVPMRATTVWFFPHAERLVLLFHGLAEVASDDGSDVVGLTGAVERLGEAKDDAHYLRVLAQRADPRMGAVHSLRDSDLLPAGLDASDPAALQAGEAFAMEGLQAEAQVRRAQIDVALARDEARAAGRDPDALGIVMPEREPQPPPDELAQYLERKIEEAERQQWEALNGTLIQMEKAIEFAAERGIDLAALQHRGPPVFKAEREVERLRSAAQGANRSFNAPAVYGPLLEKELVEVTGYLAGAHLQPPVAPMAPAAAAQLRAEMAVAVPAGLKHFSGMDLTGADFSGLDLRGVNFTGAWLESANFENANLSGANLSHAVLAHANLRGAIAVETSLVGANLGGARLASAVLEDADCRNARFDGCDWTGARLRGARLEGASWLDVVWGGVDLQRAQAAGQLFYKQDLRGTVFTEAVLDDANFIECDLRGCDLRAAHMARATFVQCRLDGVHASGVQAEGVVFVEGCSLVGADLGHAAMGSANFGGMDLSQVSLVGSMLDGANLIGTRLARSDWRLASAKGVLLCKADLAHARMAGANFSNAVLQHADLRGADLRQSNLFGADLARVRLSGDTRFDQALLTRARTWPRLTPEQQAAA
ncbi:DUF2169 family type VI secretion system accessory protein [Variovorax paradoxus]|uniref:DUF2169 domain-containing protein n=1 Tax=Variovorax paradoxus (strain EPS) TaxID=595537 RepID=E6V5I4_VARPE|nr:DUF2169 domain-containing protein [Variovorax paradoxus]ADU34790.1 Protein of unknown function DUF2169 [Variovorax paradoxus EPS]